MSCFPENAKARTNQIGQLLDEYIPAVEKMSTQIKKYCSAFQGLEKENKNLTAENEQLSKELKNSQTESTLKKLKDAKLERDYRDALAVLDRIPKEVLEAYTTVKPVSCHKLKEEAAYGKNER